jgi:hypothetical protein
VRCACYCLSIVLLVLNSQHISVQACVLSPTSMCADCVRSTVLSRVGAARMFAKCLPVVQESVSFD